MSLRPWKVSALALVLVASACGGSSETSTDSTDAVSEEAPSTTEAPAETSSTAVAPAPTETEATAISVGLALEPTTLDPTASPEGPIQSLELYNIIEPLVKIDANGSIVPLLAESWEVSDDGLTYIFSLQTGVTFHDGADFTADDVVFSLDRARGPELAHPFQPQLAQVESVTALDDATVEVVLSEFSANFLFFMAQSVGMIFDESDVGGLASNPVGTGPFVFGEWVQGDHITINQYGEYWGEPPLLEEVTYRYIEDPNALNNAMLAGDLQIIAGVSAPELLEQFESDDGFNVETGSTNCEVTFALNGREAPFSDVRVRQAIYHALNRQDIVDGAYFGYGTLIGSFAVPTDPYYLDLNGRYPYDTEKAMELLSEAGFADGFDMTLQLPPPSYARRSGEIIQSQLAEVGINVEIQNVEWSVWLADVFNVEGVEGGFNYDGSIVCHVEARDIIQYGNADYYFGYDNADVQALLASADSEPDDDARYDLLGQVQTQITEDAASIWLFVLPNLAVTEAGVEGYVSNATSQALDMTRVAYNP